MSAAAGARQPNGERARVAWAASAVFCILSGYYVLRPARDALGLASSAREMPLLFYGTLGATFCVAPLFAWGASRVRPARLLPLVYGLVAMSVLGFAALFRGSVPGGFPAKAFFVWTSVINLFLLSLFWARLSELFPRERAVRLFGPVAAAGTVGAACGSAVAGALAERIGIAGVLVVAAALFGAAAVSSQRLAATDSVAGPGGARDRAAAATQPNANTTRESPWLWAHRMVTQPRLRSLLVYMLAFTVTSTFLYLQQASIVRAASLSVGARAAYFARIDLAVNVLSIVAQGALTSRALRHLGLVGTLLVLPVVTALSFGALAFWPGLFTLAVVQVVRRTTEFAFARPTREVLFTEGPTVDRYEAKPFLDTFIYRAGDAVGATVYERLAASFGSRGVLVAALAVVVSWVVACGRLRRAVAPSGDGGVSEAEASGPACEPRARRAIEANRS